MVTRKILFQKQESQSAKQIGSCLWWSLAQCSVSRKTLEDLAKKNNIPEKYLPEQISFISAFKRGVTDIKASLDKEGILIRLINDDQDARRLAIVKETLDKTKETASHSQIGVIYANKKDKSILVEASHGRSPEELQAVEMVDERIRLAYENSINHNTDDIRRVMISFCKECTVSLRDSGGIYFVPLVHEAMLESMAEFIKAVSPDSVIYIKPEYVVRDSDLQALRQASKNELGSEVAQLEQTYLNLLQEFQDLLDDNSHLSIKKKRQLGKKLEVYRELRKRIETFSTTLEFAPNEFVDRLRVMYQSLSEKLAKLKVKISNDFDDGFAGLGVIPPAPPQPTLLEAWEKAGQILGTLRQF